jgi:hypothetical protein
MALGPVVARACFLIHAEAEELTERRRAHSANQAGLEVEEHRAGHVLYVYYLENHVFGGTNNFDDGLL